MDVERPLARSAASYTGWIFAALRASETLYKAGDKSFEADFAALDAIYRREKARHP